jgi:hypothetical protein
LILHYLRQILRTLDIVLVNCFGVLIGEVRITDNAHFLNPHPMRFLERPVFHETLPVLHRRE